MSRSGPQLRFWFVLAVVTAAVIVAIVLRQADPFTGSSPPVPNTVEVKVPGTPEHFRSNIERLVREDEYEQATGVLLQTDASLLAEHAASTNDLRWMAVYEDDLVLPGLDEKTRITARAGEYWVIPGTSDVVLQVGWQSAATEFAREYNTRLQSLTATIP